MPENPLPEPVPVLSFKSARSWESWLKKNHAQPGAIWLKYAKKNTGIPSVTYPDALDVALCWGWIDGQVKRLDETFYMQRWAKRRPRSRWSKINCGKVERLTRDGLMQLPGLAEVEAAKADGRWEAAYASPSTITEPDDFLQALNATTAAQVFYQTVNRQARYFMLYRIHEAKRPETRARRIAEFVQNMAEGKNPKGFS